MDNNEEIMTPKSIAEYIINNKKNEKICIICHDEINYVPIYSKNKYFENISYSFELLLSIVCEMAILLKIELDENFSERINNYLRNAFFSVNVEKLEEEQNYYCKVKIENTYKFYFNSKIMESNTKENIFIKDYIQEINRLSDIFAIIEIEGIFYKIYFFSLYTLTN